MKVLFLFALLANIVFFLWEVNSGVLNPQLKHDSADNEPKQILLVSELEKNEGENSLVAAAKEVDLKVVTVSSESKNNAKTNVRPISDEIVNRKKKGSGIADAKSASTVIESKAVQKELLTAIDKSPKNRKTDSSERKPALESKTVTENIVLNSVLNIKNLVSNDKKESFDNALLANDISKPPNSSIDNQKIINQTAGLDQNLVKDTVETKVEPDNPLLLNSTETTIKQTKQEKTICYQVGPFADINKFEKWRQFNKVNSESLKRFNKEIQSVSSYLVYYPAAETYAQSKKNVLMLKREGIEDFWLFRSGELKGNVSLGLFTKEDRALSLKEKLVKSGLDVEIMQRYKTESAFYAQISNKDKTFKDKVVISEPLVLSECE